jgi:hypothetical protein
LDVVVGIDHDVFCGEIVVGEGEGGSGAGFVRVFHAFFIPGVMVAIFWAFAGVRVDFVGDMECFSGQFPQLHALDDVDSSQLVTNHAQRLLVDDVEYELFGCNPSIHKTVSQRLVPQ